MVDGDRDDAAIDTAHQTELLAINEQLLLSALREQAATDRALRHAAALEYQALHDALTDLPNRTLLYDRLRQALLIAHREHTTLALLLLDLNGFKAINDRFGHAAGDLLLQQVAGRLRLALRDSDTAARLGGDEFALLLPAVVGRSNAELAVKRVLQALLAPYLIGDTPQHLTASIGIALSPEHSTEVDSLLQQADTAMYTAKRTGREVVVAGVTRDEYHVVSFGPEGMDSGPGVSVAPPERPTTAADGPSLRLLSATLDTTDQNQKEETIPRHNAAALVKLAGDPERPLAAIHESAAVLRRRVVQTAPTDRGPWLAEVGRLDAAVAAMRSMIDALLDPSRLPYSPDLHLNRTPTDLVALTRRVIDEYRRRTTDHEIRMDTAEESLAGWWNGDRLERVVADLLSNAITYSPIGGQITIQVLRVHDHHGCWAQLTIRDWGIGIPAVDLPQLFDHFHGDSSVTGEIAGTAIGLAGVPQIVTEHGGSIAVTSTEDEGSTFTLRLPLTQSISDLSSME